MSQVRESLSPALQPGELQELLQAGAPVTMIDVRTPAEFETSHIEGAYNVPLDTLGEHRQSLRQHVQDPVVLVCRSGNRARRAQDALEDIGMSHLHILEGGMAAWEAAQLPVKRSGKKERWELERQVRGVAGSFVLIGTLGSVFVHPGLVWLAAFFGAGLTFSAVTNTCAMAMLLAKLPYNRSCGCDINQVVDALKNNEKAPVSS